MELFKEELLKIRKECKSKYGYYVDESECEKCKLSKTIEVYISYECCCYEMKICEVIDSVKATD